MLEMLEMINVLCTTTSVKQHVSLVLYRGGDIINWNKVPDNGVLLYTVLAPFFNLIQVKICQGALFQFGLLELPNQNIWSVPKIATVV